MRPPARLSFIRLLSTESTQIPRSKAKAQISSSSSNVSNSERHHEMPDFSLTEEERASIENSPFMKSVILPGTPRELPEKIRITAESIPLENDFFSYKRPANVPPPFRFLQQTQKDTPRRISVGKFPRLSVTQLLTQSWCELRDFYEIYSRHKREETAAMARGHKIHLGLETATHPPVSDEVYREGIPAPDRDANDDLVYDEIKRIYKLYCLLISGRCREVYVHGFINEETGIFLPSDEPLKESDLPITGIIDHLFLRSKDPTHPLQKEANNYKRDIGDLINHSPEIIERYKDQYKLTVCDVKTRSRKSIPQQSSVIEASKLQVMLYERMLRNFNSEGSYESILSYYQRKGVNVDVPLTQEYTAIWSLLHPYFLQDFIRVSNGEKIGFEPYDNFNYSEHDEYDLTYLLDTITDDNMTEQLTPLLKPWSKPLTLRYFIAQSARLMNSVSQLLDGDLRIQYYHKNDMFQEIKFRYDESLTDKVAKHAVDFWFGHEDPVPISPTFQSIKEKCHYCDFRYHCSWKNQAVNTYTKDQKSVI